MTGTSQELLEGLLRLKNLANDVHDRLHDQEHLWESIEYPKLEKVWDEANREVWDCIHHKFLRRLYDLGGRPPGVTDDPVMAYSRALEEFNNLHAECQELYAIVEEEYDHVTEKMLQKIQKKIEGWIGYLEAKLAQARILDRSDFMAEQM